MRKIKTVTLLNGMAIFTKRHTGFFPFFNRVMAVLRNRIRNFFWCLLYIHNNG